jgi:hypothetical protein
MLVIKGGTVIDGRGGNPIPNATIVVEDQRIKEVGPVKSISEPKDATIVDATGKFVMPGLIDSHVHYRDYMPHLFLNHGITSIKDVGNVPEWITAQRDGIRKGKIPGPWIFIGGRTGAIKGFLVDIEPPGAFPPSKKISDKETAVEMIRYLDSWNVDQIKVHYGFTPELLSVITRESHDRGLEVTSHVTISARDAVASGLDGLEHGTGVVQALVDDSAMEEIYQASSLERRTTSAFHRMRTEGFKDLVDFLVDHGTRIVPTFILWGIAASKHGDRFDLETLSLLRNEGLSYIPQGRTIWWLKQNQHFWLNRLSLGESRKTRIKNLQDGYRKYQDFIALFAQRGGRLVAGTDTGFMIPGLSLHHELQEMVDAGISPMEAIVSATSVGAEFLGKNGKEVGVIEKGRLADLLIVDGNPLENIAHTENIITVVKGGNIVDTTYDPCFTNPLPSPRKLETHANRIPSIADLEPFITNEGGKDTEVCVRGGFFTRYGAVKFDGKRIPTKFINPSELTATIPARFINRPGTYPLVVENPPPEGGESHPVYFMVTFA